MAGPYSAYNAILKLTGTATSMVQEACTETVVGTTWQVTSATKRVLDPSDTYTVERDDGGGFDPVAVTDYTLDYLFGKIVFTGDVSTGDTVRITGDYLPTYEVTTAKSWDYTMSADALDDTLFSSNQFRTYTVGLYDISGTVGRFDMSQTDYDTGGTEIKIADLLTAGTPKLLEITHGSSGLLMRAWIMLDADALSSQLDSLQDAEVSFMGSAQTPSDADSGLVSFSYSDL